MTASMVIHVTEDDDPDGHVNVEFAVEGFDMATAQIDDDLPAALVLGAQMVKLAEV